jgi:DNA polymerase I
MDLQFDPKNPKYEYITNVDQLNDALEKLEKEPIIAVDVESTGLDPYTSKLLLVQVGTREISYVIDTRKIKLKESPRFKALLQDPSKIKILQNAKFDYKMLKVHTDVEVNNIFDTLLAEGILTAGLGKRLGLDALALRYLGEGAIDKSMQKSFEDLKTRVTQEQLKYAAADTLILFPIFEQQFKKLKQEHLVNIAKLEFSTTKVVADMELTGIFLDEKKWRIILKNLEIKRDEIAKEFQESIRPLYSSSQSDLFGNVANSINLNSQQQLMDLFNNRLGLEMPSTGTAILTNTHHPVVDLLSKYRGYEKLISSFGESLLTQINPKTGRIHPDFMQLKTATGRFACARPNLQQIPRNSEEAPFRECFNPAKGYKFVVSDYSSFEMRILADLSGDEKMLTALREGLDIHSYTAALMFDKEYSPDFKKKYPELRQMAKPIGFGLMYGMGAMGLIGRIKSETGKEITQHESQDLINRYFKSYPSVKSFLDKQAAEAVRNGYSKTPAGRKRWYTRPEKSDLEFRRKKSNIERQAKNHPIQGTNADAIKYALVFVDERIKKEGIDGKIILTVHDEIVCEVREDQAEAFAPILSEEMCRAGELFLKKVPVKSDPFVGDVWEH